MEYLFDTHTHSDYSHDGVPALEELVKAAVSKGLKYLAVTDHCDKDCVALPGFSWVRQIDLASRKAEMTALKAKYADKIYLADSLEYGYAPEANALYLDVQDSYPTDYVINSVHIVEGVDVYFREYFDARTKKQAYGAYLGLEALTGSNGISTLLSICVGAAVFVVLIFVFKAITVEELKSFPGGRKLSGVVRRFVK